MNYTNVVTSIKAKPQGGASGVSKEVCDLKNVAVPVYVYGYWKAVGTPEPGEEQQYEFAFKENTSEIKYNRIPENFLEFMNKYYNKYSVMPNFYYNVTIDNTDTPNENKRLKNKVSNGNDFILTKGQSSSTYMDATLFGEKITEKFNEFIKDTSGGEHSLDFNNAYYSNDKQSNDSSTHIYLYNNTFKKGTDTYYFVVDAAHETTLEYASQQSTYFKLYAGGEVSSAKFAVYTYNENTKNNKIWRDDIYPENPPEKPYIKWTDLCNGTATYCDETIENKRYIVNIKLKCTKGKTPKEGLCVDGDCYVLGTQGQYEPRPKEYLFPEGFTAFFLQQIAEENDSDYSFEEFVSSKMQIYLKKNKIENGDPVLTVSLRMFSKTYEYVDGEDSDKVKVDNECYCNKEFNAIEDFFYLDHDLKLPEIK